LAFPSPPAHEVQDANRLTPNTPCTAVVCHEARPLLRATVILARSPGPAQNRQVPRAPSLRWRYPSVIATTSPCVSPSPSHGLSFIFVPRIFAGCCQPLLGEAPSRRYLCGSFDGCLDPYPGSPQGAPARYFSWDIGLPPVRTGSAHTRLRTATSVRAFFRGCSHSLMFRPPLLLALQVAPTAEV